MTEEKTIERLREAKFAQLKERSEASNKAGEKAMEVDLERILKQSDIIFTINGLVLAIIIFILAPDNKLSIVLFVIGLILIFVQSLSLRNIRNKISMTMKRYLLENAKILKGNIVKLIKLKIEESEKVIEGLMTITEGNKEDINKAAIKSTETTDILIKKQEFRKYITIINILLLLIMIFMKYGILQSFCL